ncbi:MAG: hypothetical protein ACREKS_03025 [Candidatus Rokuibacteriota bacterium]
MCEIAGFFVGQRREIQPSTLSRMLSALPPLDGVQELVREHLDGHRDHRKTLWALMMFDAWRESYVPRARWT